MSEWFFLYDGKCYSKCSDLNDESKQEYYRPDNENQIYHKCRENCIDCLSDFNICQKCSSLYYVDEKAHLCVLISSKGFFKSHKFTQSSLFSPSNPFANRQNHFKQVKHQMKKKRVNHQI